MKKLLFINKFPLQWENWLADFCKDKDVYLSYTPTAKTLVSNYIKYDLAICAWADEDAVLYTNNPMSKHTIVVIRAYEAFNKQIRKIKWDNVDKILYVNEATKYECEEMFGLDGDVIYNPLYTDALTYDVRFHGNKVAMVCNINPKKNLSLALQAVSLLGDRYELHIAGEIQCHKTYMYLSQLAFDMNINLYLHGFVHDIDKWLDDKNYIMSTSVTEGCPNNILEALYKGIKPLIHSWPGARHIYPDSFLWSKLTELPNMVISEYDSSVYKEFILEHNSKIKSQWGELFDKYL